MSLRQQLLESFRTSKEYRHSFIEESIRTGLAAQIRAIREARRLDPKAFAAQLGKKVAWIYRLEDPNAAVPTVPSLLDVARTFDVDLRVEFRPFSERLDDLSRISEKSFEARSFADELVDIERQAETEQVFIGKLMSAPPSGNSDMARIVCIDAKLRNGYSAVPLNQTLAPTCHASPRNATVMYFESQTPLEQMLR
jgi:transcriptional regulator with XRE-family HTH domain